MIHRTAYESKPRDIVASDKNATLTARSRKSPVTVERLYHLAEGENLSSIMEHGLLSTEKLLEMAGLSEPERVSLLRGHRLDCVRLPSGTVVRDQRPMPPAALAPALDDGLEPADWYALLNAHVFLWPDADRMERQRKACGDRQQYILTFDAVALFKRFGDRAFVSPINSGNARRKPARRGRDTFVPYASWSQYGWPTGVRLRPPAEFLFQCSIPTTAPYLINVQKA